MKSLIFLLNDSYLSSTSLVFVVASRILYTVFPHDEYRGIVHLLVQIKCKYTHVLCANVSIRAAFTVSLVVLHETQLTQVLQAYYQRMTRVIISCSSLHLLQYSLFVPTVYVLLYFPSIIFGFRDNKAE